MSIAVGLSGIKTTADLVKGFRDGLKAGTVQPDEIAGRIGEIYDYIIDSKEALADAKGEIDAVYIIFSEFKSVMTANLVVEKLLPIEKIVEAPGAKDDSRAEHEKNKKRQGEQDSAEIDYIYEQPPEHLLGGFVSSRLHLNHATILSASFIP